VNIKSDIARLDPIILHKLKYLNSKTY